MSKSNNPFHNSAFNSKKPAKQKDHPVEKGEPFIEEELEAGLNDIDELEEEIETAKENHQSRDELRDEVRGLEAELKEVGEKVLRVGAEMENVRRRAAVDVQNAHKYGTEKFVKELLPVVDSLEKALENGVDSTIEAFHDGVELTHQMLLKTLEKHGVKIVDPLNETFDPNLHEAMSMQESPDVKPNTVVTVFQKGYELNGRLIRPALVVVSK